MKSFVACWAACWAAAVVAAEAPADAAWVWDHQQPPRAASAWALTVVRLQLSADGVQAQPRRQVPAGAQAVAITPVVHVEPLPRGRGELLPAQRATIVQWVRRAAAGSTSGWVQLDFEAKPGQRESYRELMREVRAALPKTLKLSATVLAWQCRSSAWIDGLAADEVVPMLFRLGADRERWREEARDGGRGWQPRCRQEAIGLAPQETPPAEWQSHWPRRYWFNLLPGARVAWPPDLENAVWPRASAPR